MKSRITRTRWGDEVVIDVADDVYSVREFLQRYYRPDRLDPDRLNRMVQTYGEELQKTGKCFITHHSSITGHEVEYYGPA